MDGGQQRLIGFLPQKQTEGAAGISIEWTAVETSVKSQLCPRKGEIIKLHLEDESV